MQTQDADSNSSPDGSASPPPTEKRRLLAEIRWAPAVAAALAVFLIAVATIGWRAARAVRLSTEEVRSEGQLRFSIGAFRPTTDANFEVVSAPAVFLAATQFQNQLYIAGPSELLVYDLQGNLLRQFAVGRDLPPSPLVAMTTAVLADSDEQELLIAMASEGLLAYNGRNLRQIYSRDAEVRSVTAILPTADGHLLIGTKRRGVLLYDVKHITALHPSLSGLYVQALAGTESDLWVGTLAQGVFHWRAGSTDAFSESQGLPDQQVQSGITSGDQTFVGTLLGVAEFDRARFSRVLASGVLTTALLSTHDRHLTMDASPVDVRFSHDIN